MPARIAVHLVPGLDRPLTPLPQTGPAVQAALLKAIHSTGPAELATAMHDTRPPLPYAVTPLLDERDKPASAASTDVRFEVGVLADQITAPVMHALMETVTIRVARCLYRVRTVEVVAAAPYAEFPNEPRTCWRFRIRTPMAFATAREEGVRRVRVFPEPEWVFDSLYNRWSAFAEPLPEAVRVAVHRHMEVTDHRLATAGHLVKAGQPLRQGSVGEITYRLAEPDKVPHEVRAGVDALACFATYAGIGDRTAVGMGLVRLITRPTHAASVESTNGHTSRRTTGT